MMDKLVELLQRAHASYYGKENHGKNVYEVMADYILAHGSEFATDINDGCKWKRSAEELPKNFVSVLGYIPSAAPMPTVRECYTIHDQFYFPALNAMYSAKAVTRWRYMPEEPKEGDTE